MQNETVLSWSASLWGWFIRSGNASNLSGAVATLLKFKAMQREEMQKTLYQQQNSTTDRHMTDRHTISQRTIDQPSATLSERELQVLRLIAEGYSNPEIATALYLSLSTVKSHIRNIMHKLQMEHRIQLAVFAVRNQLA